MPRKVPHHRRQHQDWDGQDEAYPEPPAEIGHHVAVTCVGTTALWRMPHCGVINCGLGNMSHPGMVHSGHR